MTAVRRYSLLQPEMRIKKTPPANYSHRALSSYNVYAANTQGKYKDVERHVLTIERCASRRWIARRTKGGVEIIRRTKAEVIKVIPELLRFWLMA